MGGPDEDEKNRYYQSKTACNIFRDVLVWKSLLPLPIIQILL